ncbi:hypothetical protein M092_1270 [Parabacteroides distasonis str. 3776 D15 iv]|uniref:Uncharacterized protein n=1 Tax=Parabacteroides distasonis str. 3776 D15 i TaxID=1339342 RepID=A0AB34LGG7_PARDI|nr:hypothetical protein M091_4630 [Parabacteroides distasonis str. 3776 D15 i]KDS51256.1 hypothetical protein M090_2440 [Parabacteroides distasonis str. 3776 Po2 i]KDS67890.1 hypothetical protein M096_3715 [Parabacteroides distasonis str. 3999B T(B) 6]KDS68951.1 hypothetical protein M095_1680 [Parabacteroides distasonis str. 3999B T(B) 4]KDS72515.1 hypothetical protein M092_1270 [Parabacteroides distasonis str. 3776 D15 iv]
MPFILFISYDLLYREDDEFIHSKEVPFCNQIVPFDTFQLDYSIISLILSPKQE